MGVGVGVGVAVRERLLLCCWALCLCCTNLHSTCLRCVQLSAFSTTSEPPGFCVRAHQGLAGGRAAEKTKVVRELACQVL